MKWSFSLLKAKDPEQLRQQKDILILLGIAISVWLIYFLSNFNGLKYPDAMHYASIARNIITGKGMLVNDISPGQIALLKTNYFRSIAATPLHPIIMSLFFYVFGINDYAVAFSSGVFYLLAVPIIYLLASELFGRKVGIISTLLYIINLELLNYSISGLTESLFIFLLLLGFIIIYKSSSLKDFLLVGVILGLCRLTRINAIIFILPFMAYIYLICNNRKITSILIFLAGFIGMSFPIMYRDYTVFNDPIFSGFQYGLMHFKYSSDITARSLLLSESPNLLRAIFSDLSGFIKYCINNIHIYYVNFLGITKPLIMSFFIVSLFRWHEDKKRNVLKLVILSSIIIQVLLLSVTKQTIRYFHIFIPLIIMFGVEYLIYLFERLPFKVKIHRYLAAGVLLIFLSGPFFYYLTGACYNKITFNEKQKFHWLKDFLEKNSSPEDIIVTNHWAAMWYGNRRTISLPISVKVMEEIDTKFLPIDAILLTSDVAYISEFSVLSETERRFVEEWKELLYNPPKRFSNFVFVKSFTDEKLKAVLFIKEKGRNL